MAEEKEAWMLRICRAMPQECLALCRPWRCAALSCITDLKLSAGTPLEVALSVVAQRPHLLSLDASKCSAFHGDDALQQLSAVLRGVGHPKPRPWLRPGEGLQRLCLPLDAGLTRASCRCLQRLGLERWAFHRPPTRGAVLVSRPLFPGVEQPELIRSVILLLQHDRRGSVGILLNKQCKLEPDLGRNTSAPVFFGGSMGHRVALLHASEELKGEEIAKGVFLTYQEDIMARAKDLVRWKQMSANELCWIYGYCQWHEGELDAEVLAGHIYSAFCDSAFLQPPLSDNLWQHLASLLL